MWTIIGLVVLVIIIKFIYDSYQQKESVQKQGGMLNKYSTLISIILLGDPRTKIQKVGSDSVDIILSNVGGATAFLLTQTFGKLTVQWKVQSPIYGSHKLEWDFPEFLDQEKMFEKIENDVEKYQINVLSARGFTDSIEPPHIESCYLPASDVITFEKGGYIINTNQMIDMLFFTGYKVYRAFRIRDKKYDLEIDHSFDELLRKSMYWEENKGIYKVEAFKNEVVIEFNNCVAEKRIMRCKIRDTGELDVNYFSTTKDTNTIIQKQLMKYQYRRDLSFWFVDEAITDIDNSFAKKGKIVFYNSRL